VASSPSSPTASSSQQAAAARPGRRRPPRSSGNEREQLEADVGQGAHQVRRLVVVARRRSYSAPRSERGVGLGHSSVTRPAKQLRPGTASARPCPLSRCRRKRHVSAERVQVGPLSGSLKNVSAAVSPPAVEIGRFGLCQRELVVLTLWGRDATVRAEMTCFRCSRSQASVAAENIAFSRGTAQRRPRILRYGSPLGRAVPGWEPESPGRALRVRAVEQPDRKFESSPPSTT